MASIPHTDPMALRQSIEVPGPSGRRTKDSSHNHHTSSKRNSALTNGHAMTIEMPSDSRTDMQEHTMLMAAALVSEAGDPPSHDNCNRQHEGDGTDPTIALSSTNKVAGMTVAPFLARHIPEQYAPMGLGSTSTTTQKDPNTKYCYRHRPDSKCRRTADEPTMENLQRVC